VEKTENLYELWLKYQQAEDANSLQDVEKLVKQLDLAFEEASGNIFKTLRESQSYAFKKAALARATGDRFADQLKAYSAAPEIYIHEQRSSMLEKALKDARKYIVVADQNDTQVTIIDLEESRTPSIYTEGVIEESSKK
jgi:hypothetical protein